MLQNGHVLQHNSGDLSLWFAVTVRAWGWNVENDPWWHAYLDGNIWHFYNNPTSERRLFYPLSFCVMNSPMNPSFHSLPGSPNPNSVSKSNSISYKNDFIIIPNNVQSIFGVPSRSLSLIDVFIGLRAQTCLPARFAPRACHYSNLLEIWWRDAL